MHQFLRALSRSLLVVALIFITLIGHDVQSQTAPSVANGVRWLNAQVQPNGSLSGETLSIATPMQVRGEVAQTLQLLSTTPVTLSALIASEQDANTEYLARKIISQALIQADSSTLVAQLITRVNPDGGFGGARGYASTPLDTALSLLALKLAGRTETVAAAITYLQSSQKADGSFQINGRIDLYSSIYALAAFRAHASAFSLNAAIQSTATFLLAQQSAPGSWNSSIFLSSLAYEALHDFIPAVPTAAAVQTYLLGAQRSDGSWGGDPYTTALALRALVLTGNVPLDPGLSVLRGKVIDSQTGLPLAGVNVAISGAATVNMTTAEDGIFLFNNQPPGNYKLTASIINYGMLSTDTSVKAGQIQDFGNLLMSKKSSAITGTIRGVVTDAATGQPLSGVSVIAGALLVKTDSLGVYQLTNVPAGAVSIAASKSGYQSRTGSNTINAGDVWIFSPAMSTVGGGASPVSADVSGVVVDAGTNLPLSGVSIAAVDGTDSHAAIATDASGKFIFNGANALRKDVNGNASLTFNIAGYTAYQTVVWIDGFEKVDMGQIRLRKTSVSNVLPDLSVAKIDRSAAITDAQSLKLTGQVLVTLQNLGGADIPQGTKILAFHDSNKNRKFDSGSDQVLGTISLSSTLSAGQAVVVPIPVQGTLPFRDAPITVFGDSDQSVLELTKTNNIKSSADFVEIRPDPTLFKPKLKWEWKGGDVIATPVVGPLTDTNGDGKFDEKDIPTVIAIVALGIDHAPGVLTALSGKDGHGLWQVNVPDLYTWSETHPAIGVLGDDGKPNVVMELWNGGIAIFNHDGSLKCRSSETRPGNQNSTYYNYGGVTIADLYGDGKPVVLLGSYIFNGDCTTRAIWDKAFVSGLVTTVADIDGDGVPEVLFHDVHKNNGTLLWSPQYGRFPAVARLDPNDPLPQVVYAGAIVDHTDTIGGSARAFLSAYRHDGTPLFEHVFIASDTDNVGYPTIADLDGDGIPEIGIASSGYYSVYNADGSLKWRVRTNDGSGLTGSTSFDFDGSGNAKIVYFDEKTLRVFDGKTGTTLFSAPNDSATASEYPIVVDVDGDGHADIVIPSNSGGTRGIRVFQDENNAWVRTRKIWNEYDYHINNVNDDGSIPRKEVNSWATHNTWRLNALIGESSTAVADVTASYVRVNDRGGKAASVLTVRIGNAGGLVVPAGTKVAFYSGQAGAGGSLLGTAVTGMDLNSNDYQDISLNYAGALSSVSTLVIVADDDGTGVHALSDFDVKNNTVSLSMADLPGAFAIAVATDLTSYGANSNVQISSTITNQGSFDNNAQVQFTVQTLDGVPVTSLGKQTIKVLTSAPGKVYAIWNTAATLAGKYQIVAQIIDANGLPYVQASSPLTIVSGTVALTAKVSTDKTSYTVTDTVQLRDTISNITQNLPVDNLQIVTTVSNPDGTVRFSKTETLVQLAAANAKDYTYSLPLSGAVAGTYAVKVVASSGSAVLVQASGSFVVTSSATNGSGLTGTLAVTPAQVQAGGVLTLNFSVNNQGNSALTNQALSVNIIDPASQKIIAQFPYTTNLAIGSLYNGNTTWTATGSNGATYVATLSATFGANIINLAQANITITAPVINVTTAIDTDKAAYAPTDTVQLHDRITNVATSQAASNLQLVVTVKNPDGTTRFTKTETLVSLAASAIKDYSYSLNLSAAPAGQYSATVVVSSGSTVVSQASAAFTVASTAATGSGLKGSISASTAQVPVGNIVSFSFNVNNLGNADLTDLPMTVSITEAGTQKVIASFPYKASLAMAALFSATTDWTSAGTAGTQYNAVLSAKVGTTTLTLGQAPFSLIAPVVSLTVKQVSAPWQNVLVYSTCKRAADELLGKCAATSFPTENATTLAQCDTTRATRLDNALTNLGISHTVSTNVASFLSNLRSGQYNTYWISNGAGALQEPAATELLAAIKRGQGFMLDSLVTATSSQLTQCSGVSNNGAYATALQQLSLSGGIFNRADLSGPATQVKMATTTGVVEATLNTGGNSASPGIVSASFGAGKTLAFGFDWNDTLLAQPTDARWPALIKQGLTYLTPAAADLTTLLPGDISTLTSTITNAGASQTLRIVQTLPAGAVVQSSTPAATLSNSGGNVVATWDITAASATDTSVSLRWKAPTEAGSYTANLAVSLVNGSTVTAYKTQDQSIKVQSASQLNSQLISVVQGLNLSTALQLAQRTAVLASLADVTTALNSNSMDKALRTLLTVQARVKNIETGVGPVSKSLASLIAVVGRQNTH
ncbi:carboxypeptidase-like regulatory domain-containing protein [Undibacterium sp. CY18W]|uniref:Carboxypeptidase-like regulatory domain-containing protein n=1 Tax=Undibacterium hunanense TaxID=2762292 RepID=A0ABR6ZWH4_9BURK|nr:carboxypeptidase-like regulatory domain-containing protein [Undibacterium hunanense]MBC3920139.1 carboxypeptidase-like regulatory domain-containing protein [Undibacterium hunanense]